MSETKKPIDDDDCPPPQQVPLFNKVGIGDRQHIIFVEREDAVLTIRSVTEHDDEAIGAVTCFDGTDQAKHADFQPLAGRTVYLWPDNDPKENGTRPSVERMKDIQKILKKLEPSPKVFWINPYELDLPPNGNVIDFLLKYESESKGLEQLHSVLANAQLVGPAKGVKKRLEDAISGKRETIRLPWYGLHYATQALKPGTVTLICGDGGAAKSLCLLQCCQYWHFDLGHEVAVYELEDDRSYHLLRALAQCSRQPNLMDESWVKDNADEAREIFNENKEFLDNMGHMIFEAPTEAVGLIHIAEWVSAQAKAGKRIICIDPITAAEQGQNSWIEDKAFIIEAKKSIVEYGASLVIVTHPKKGGGSSVSMDNLAGGACWSRFSQTILWLKNPGEDKEVDILVEGCRESTECNRIMTVLKARNSYGSFHGFGMNLENLVLDEVGELARKKKSKKRDDE